MALAPNHFVSASCAGEICSGCLWVKDYLEPHIVPNAATHKIQEVIFDDDPDYIPTDSSFSWGGFRRHPMTAYLCCEHYQMIFGRCTVAGF